ncbi:MAG: septum formation initiator family protein [Patescibacteria group bacterium]|nr:septum formation initiator family protein [Patescibacteria group bacterium]
MKIIVNILLASVIAILGWQLFNLYQQYSYLKDSSDKQISEMASLKQENAELNSDIKYFSNPINLERELKSQSNYKDPGEKMIIVVSTSTQQ